jgi:4-amino-4-deoxy-L-arabinose transferase-like glycosyltransferase
MMLLLAVCWLGIGRDLWTPDEPREAEISREMWLAPSVVPSLNDQVFIEKPPLYYWTVAGVFELVGGASAWAARSVSAAASFLTLVLVFLWGRRELSPAVGALAAVGLATSVQFMISSHWVLIDPLLMLFATVAAWAGWELLARDGGRRAVLALYAALVLALWTKGLIGPVLLGFGFAAHAAWTRKLKPLWRLRPFVGAAALLAATGVFALLVYRSAGYAAVREWFWVNHVLRFVEPEYTGHAQPFYYYLVNIPTAVLPWWVPFADVFRPRRWRDPTMPNRDLRVYLASLCLGMALILSASTTKRSIYLLPMLPPLALLIAAHGAAWCERAREGLARAWPWWTQAALLIAFAAGPALLGMFYVRRVDPLALGILAAVAVLVAALVVTRKQKTGRGLAALGASAVAGVVSLFAVAMHFGGEAKDMSEFVAWIDEQIPANESVYGYGSLDETFDGIVPFVTGRKVVALDAADIERLAPTHIVVQDKDGGTTAPDLSARYDLLGERNFGPGRYFAVWQRRAANAHGNED